MILLLLKEKLTLCARTRQPYAPNTMMENCAKLLTLPIKIINSRRNACSLCLEKENLIEFSVCNQQFDCPSQLIHHNLIQSIMLQLQFRLVHISPRTFHNSSTYSPTYIELGTVSMLVPCTVYTRSQYAYSCSTIYMRANVLCQQLSPLALSWMKLTNQKKMTKNYFLNTLYTMVYPSLSFRLINKFDNNYCCWVCTGNKTLENGAWFRMLERRFPPTFSATSHFRQNE